MISSLLRKEAFINGKWLPSVSGKTFLVSNPASLEKIVEVADCNAKDADLAIQSSDKAFYEHWGFSTTAKFRHDLLLKAFTIMQNRKEDLARLMTLEQGKPLADSRGEIDYASAFLKWFAEQALRIHGEIVPAPANNRKILFMKEPVGVAALITPWNFPSAMITRKAAAALAAGCTCIVKPAEDTPLSALALAAVFDEAGFPPGVFNVLPASRASTPEVGKALCEHEKVSILSFTGSTPVGKILLSQCASTVKKVGLELGGNAPFIVFDSADMDKAVTGAMASKFRCSGQTCICSNRIFVQENVYEEFVGKLSDAMKSLNLGSGLEEGVNQGPLINERAVQKIDALLSNARDKGADIIMGGKRAKDKGQNFYQPTIVGNVSPDMDIFKTEIFGPVASIIKFSTEEEVVKLANDTRVGLAGYFYSSNVAQIFRVARKLEVGMVGVNEGLISGAEAAFGGVKESGLGIEGSHHGVDEYLNTKYVCLGGLD